MVKTRNPGSVSSWSMHSWRSLYEAVGGFSKPNLTWGIMQSFAALQKYMYFPR